MSGPQGPQDDSRAARIERELWALLPVALLVSQDAHEDRQATARRIIRVVRLVVSPHLAE